VNPDMVVSYLRDLIADITRGARPTFDADGDLPVEFEGAQCFARVLRVGREVVVQTFSVVSQVDYTQELGDALNALNRELVFTRAFHTDGQVLIENDIFADDLSKYTLSRSLYFVAGPTSEYGPRLVETFGGTPKFDPRPASAPDEGDSLPGLYL
jgi:hypothetical protein